MKNGQLVTTTVSDAPKKSSVPIVPTSSYAGGENAYPPPDTSSTSVMGEYDTESHATMKLPTDTVGNPLYHKQENH